MKIDSSKHRQRVRDECNVAVVCPSAILGGASLYGEGPAPDDAGAYFLIYNGEVTYVGHAKRIRKRLQSHRSEQLKYGEKQWTHYYAITGISEAAARTLESFYIEWLVPMFNRKIAEGSDAEWVQAKLHDVGGPVCDGVELCRGVTDFDREQIDRLNNYGKAALAAGRGE